ncbi:MAG: polysaccharide biosynthesis C-terminal domain-containing protein, partial [Clostridia bacterium]|nr:polysaccharide biosynthesis C-terminal domain-containing protein [Clostridia bacterium]
MAVSDQRQRSAAEQAQYEKLVGTPIPKLIPRLAVPTVLSMMITMLYNLADSFFVGKLGTSASASVGIVMSILATFQAFGFLFGHGAGAVVSRQLGRGEKAEANKTVSTSFFLTLVVGFFLSAMGLLTLHPLMRLLGSTETILPYSVEYARWIFLSGTFFCSSCVLNNVLRYEGRAFYAMIGLVSGSVLNIFLDPLFIFGFHLGIRGAGMATAVSQTISFLL